jgi:transcriptional regulator NrdR family protein
MDTSSTSSSGAGAMNVEKRDGTVEAFDRSKVVRSCASAGATPEQCEMIATGIEQWMSNANGAPVKSTEIRDRVIEALRTESPDTASAFEAYVKEG